MKRNNARLLMLFLSGMILTACQESITEQFSGNETPKDWIGETPVALISEKGSPSQVINNNGMQYLIYTLINGQPINTSNSNGANLNFENSARWNMPFCEIVFTIQNGLISQVEQKGNSCEFNLAPATPR